VRSVLELCQGGPRLRTARHSCGVATPLPARLGRRTAVTGWRALNWPIRRSAGTAELAAAFLPRPTSSAGAPSSPCAGRAAVRRALLRRAESVHKTTLFAPKSWMTSSPGPQRTGADVPTRRAPTAHPAGRRRPQRGLWRARRDGGRRRRMRRISRRDDRPALPARPPPPWPTGPPRPPTRTPRASCSGSPRRTRSWRSTFSWCWRSTFARDAVRSRCARRGRPTTDARRRGDRWDGRAEAPVLVSPDR